MHVRERCPQLASAATLKELTEITQLVDGPLPIDSFICQLFSICESAPYPSVSPIRFVVPRTRIAH